MSPVPQTVVIGTRISRETKARFAALAAQQGLTESALLALLVDNVVAANGLAPDCAQPKAASHEAQCATDRLTLRLRPGDRALADAKAAARRMKTSSYLAMLVRFHVRGASVMPPAELEELKCIAAHLAALVRLLRALQECPRGTVTATPQQLLLDVGSTVERAREAVAGVVRTNLISWEAGHA